MSRVFRSTRSRRACAVNAAVAVETLEVRRLLACDVDVYGDTLIVKGDSAANDISVTEENDVVVVTCDGDAETISGEAGRGNVDVDVNIEDDDGDLERVSIDGSDGHDEITLVIGELLIEQAEGAIAPSSGGGGGGDWSGYHGED